MGFEVRWRIDPILPVDGWQDVYREFLSDAAIAGYQPTRITLGTYREMGKSLLTIADRWGLPRMDFTPGRLMKDGMHYHLPDVQRIEIYRRLIGFIKLSWARTRRIPIIALCKETRSIREALNITHGHCNCE